MARIKRRDVLSATGLTLAAATMSGGAQPAGRAVTRGRIRQSVSRWCYAKIPMPEFCRAVAAMGLTAIDLTRADTTIGLLLGAMFPFLFAAMTMSAVGRAANRMIDEVRRQFREIPGLRDGEPGARPEYAKCVDIATTGALREMVIPATMAVALPLTVGFVDIEALGGLLAGALVTGFLLAIFMSNAGGAWDNAKKFIETGAFGGKGSDAHKAAVIGDTVGDPFKDTAGPSMNIVIKVMTIVSLIFASAFVS
jgi:K(+)-stimulated pyrophosphate-energized sodium pump